MRLRHGNNKYVNGLIKQAHKLFSRQRKYMADNNETTNGLLEFLDKCPDYFSMGFSVGDRDMIKWALSENIKQNQLLIDKIKAVETELGLPLEYDDD